MHQSISCAEDHTRSLKPGSIQTHATQALALRAMRALRKRKMQATKALSLATVISCFDRAILLAGAYVRCVKNRIGFIVAFSYAMTACVSCVTCACVAYFCSFCLRNFLAYIAFLAHFLFCLRTFSYARPCVRLNGNRALESRLTVKHACIEYTVI